MGRSLTTHKIDDTREVRACLCRIRVDSARRRGKRTTRAAEAALAARLERAKREGDLPADAKPTDLARYVYTVCHGLAVQSVGGATRAQLRRVVDQAMHAWPSR